MRYHQLLRFFMLLAIAGTTAAGAAGMASLWLSSWRNVAERIELAQQKIARTQWIVSHETELRQRLANQVSLKSQQSDYIVAPDESRALATLQHHIKNAIDASGSSILSAQPLGIRKDGDNTTVAARVQLTTTSAGLVKFLHALEMKTPYLFIDLAEITAPPVPIQNAQTSTGSDLTPLSVQLDLHGFWREDGNG